MKRMLAAVACMLFLCGCAGQEAAIETSGENTEEPRYMALTFDDGPSSHYTPQLLDGLRERDAHATFFVIGNLAEEHPDLIRRMAAEGHQVGNHSYDHARLDEIRPGEALQDLRECDDLLTHVLGEGEYWVRPPYGFISEPERAEVPAPMVCWSVDTEDWKSRDADAVLDIILRQADDGDIILLHDQYPTSVQAALQAVDHLTARGVRFVTVEELFRIKGTEPACGTVYYSARQSRAAEDTASCPDESGE